jgi:hypothetical protein
VLRELLDFLLGVAKAWFRAKPDAVAEQAHAAGVAEAQLGQAQASAQAVSAAQASAEHVAAHNRVVLADAGASPDSVRPDLQIEDPFERD